MVKAKIRTLGHFTTAISPTTKRTQEGFRWWLKKIHKTLFSFTKTYSIASPRNIRFQTTCVNIDWRAHLDWILPFTCALLVNWEWEFSKPKNKQNSTKNLPKDSCGNFQPPKFGGRFLKSKLPGRPRSYYKIKRVPKAFFAFPKFGASHRKEFEHGFGDKDEDKHGVDGAKPRRHLEKRMRSAW